MEKPRKTPRVHRKWRPQTAVDKHSIQPCPPKKVGFRNATCRKKSEHFELMKLPSEVRQRVLEFLLYSNNPLLVERDVRLERKKFIPSVKSFEFCPAILRTSRQLHAEGIPILYRNSLDAKVDTLEHFVKGKVTLGKVTLLLRDRAVNPDLDCNTNLLPPMLANHLRSISLRYVVNCSTWQVRKEPIRLFVDQLKMFPKLQILRVDVCLTLHGGEPVVGEEFRAMKSSEALRPLNLIRGLKAVEFTGAVPPDAADLVARMTSHDPVTDLPQMFRALQAKVRGLDITYPLSVFKIRTLLADARRAMDENDSTLFWTAEDALAQLADQIFLAHQEAACKHNKIV